jgi:hypothetical protein
VSDRHLLPSTTLYSLSAQYIAVIHADRYAVSTSMQIDTEFPHQQHAEQPLDKLDQAHDKKMCLSLGFCCTGRVLCADQDGHSARLWYCCCWRSASARASYTSEHCAPGTKAVLAGLLLPFIVLSFDWMRNAHTLTHFQQRKAHNQCRATTQYWLG